MSVIFYHHMFSDLMFLEASALTGENVEEAFLQCAKTILSKVETGNANFFKIFYCQIHSYIP